MTKRIIKIYVSLVVILFFSACQHKKKVLANNFNYKIFKDSISKQPTSSSDSSNFFDDKDFDPTNDSINDLIMQIDTVLHQDARLILKKDSTYLNGNNIDSILMDNGLKTNILLLDSFLLSKNMPPTSDCQGKDCMVYAEIDKSTQTLYLYVSGEITDSFKVSTGIKSRETPNLDLSPRGPILMKYTSKKYPGGNYNHLGNMPYAVFLKGGYAIHGTTTGSFPKLGTRASHGCVRLHPDDTKVFYELVKLAGLSHTWVTIKDSLQ